MGIKRTFDVSIFQIRQYTYALRLMSASWVLKQKAVVPNHKDLRKDGEVAELMLERRSELRRVVREEVRDCGDEV